MAVVSHVHFVGTLWLSIPVSTSASHLPILQAETLKQIYILESDFEGFVLEYFGVFLDGYPATVLLV